MDELAFHRRMFRPGAIVDVGAHDGAMTLPLAALPGACVLAFEPLPAAFSRLEAAVRAAHGGEVPGHIVLHPTALGDRPGRLMLDVPVVGGVAQEQWASVAKDYPAIRGADPRVGAIIRTEVDVITLDSLGLADVTAIKLDAEGAEAAVLRGAEATLRRCLPVLSVEIEERHRTGSTQVVPAWLGDLGYHGFFSLDGRLRPIAAFDSATMQVASPSPASYEVSDPYVFIFFFVTASRMTDLLPMRE